MISRFVATAQSSPTWRHAVLFLEQRPTVRLGLAMAILTASGLATGLAVGRAPLPLAAGLAGALALFALVQEPRIGVYATVAVAALLPFGVIPLPLGGVQFTFLDATLILTLFLWLARVMLLPGQRLHVTWVGGLVLLFVGFTAVGFVNGLDYGIPAANVRLYAKSVVSILFFFTTINCLRSPNDVRWLLAVLVAAGALAGAIGVGLYALSAERAISLLSLLGPLGYPTGGDVLRYLAESDRIRAVGTSIDPNFFGAMLMVCGVFAATQVPAPKPLVPRLFLVAALGPIGLALLLSLSRSSWVGLAAGIVFVALLRYRRLWLLIVPAAAAVVLDIVPGLGNFTGHLLAGFIAQDRATLMRLGEYKDAFNLIAAYPWFGVGYGNPPSPDTYIGVSSLYLLLAENAGLVGLAAYLAAVVGLFVYCLPVALGKGDELVSGLVLSCLACVFAALVAGIFDHHFVNIRVPHILALFWHFAGLAVLLTRFAPERSRAEEGT